MTRQAATREPAPGRPRLLDRFAVVVDDGRGVPALCDAVGDRSADLATGFGTVLARGPFVWWSTGDNTRLTWHVLDLRTL